MTFDEWSEKIGIKDNPFIDKSVMGWCKAAFEAGQRFERKECALLAQSFQIANCKSHYDDAVDSVADRIKEAIIDRGTN